MVRFFGAAGAAFVLLITYAAMADPLGSMEERAAYVLFGGVRAGELVGACNPTQVSPLPASAGTRFETVCPASGTFPELRWSLEIQRTGRCTFRVVEAKTNPSHDERFEGEADFSDADWSALQAAGSMISGREVVSLRQTYFHSGPPGRPTIRNRQEALGRHPVQIFGDNPEELTARWRAVVAALRAECPGRG
jgi:hypothetical protein